MNVRPCILLFNKADDSLQTKVLLLRYRYSDEDVYALPGGNPDKGETLPETIVRELREEVGVTVAVGSMILCGEVILDQVKNDVLHVVFQGEITDGIPTLNPQETTALAVVWKSVQELEGLNVYPNVGRSVHKWFTDDSAEPGYVGRIAQRYF